MAGTTPPSPPASRLAFVRRAMHSSFVVQSPRAPSRAASDRALPPVPSMVPPLPPAVPADAPPPPLPPVPPCGFGWRPASTAPTESLSRPSTALQPTAAVASPQERAVNQSRALRMPGSLKRGARGVGPYVAARPVSTQFYDTSPGRD